MLGFRLSLCLVSGVHLCWTLKICLMCPQKKEGTVNLGVKRLSAESNDAKTADDRFHATAENEMKNYLLKIATLHSDL